MRDVYGFHCLDAAAVVDGVTTVVVIVIIIIIIIAIRFMHDIYNYIPETSHVPTVYTVAAVLYLQSVLHVMLFL